MRKKVERDNEKKLNEKQNKKRKKINKTEIEMIKKEIGGK